MKNKIESWLADAKELVLTYSSDWDPYADIGSLEKLVQNRGITPETNIIELYRDYDNITPVHTGHGRQMYLFKPTENLPARVVNPFATNGVEPTPIPIAEGNYLFDVPGHHILSTVTNECGNTACTLGAIWSGIHEGRVGLEQIAEEVAERAYATPEDMMELADLDAVEDYLLSEGYWVGGGKEGARRRNVQNVAKQLGDGVISFGLPRQGRHSIAARGGRIVDVMLPHLSTTPQDIYLVAGTKDASAERVEDFLSKRL